MKTVEKKKTTKKAAKKTTMVAKKATEQGKKDTWIERILLNNKVAARLDDLYERNFSPYDIQIVIRYNTNVEDQGPYTREL